MKTIKEAGRVGALARLLNRGHGGLMHFSTNEVSAKEAALILEALPEPRKTTYLHLAAQYADTETEVLILAARLYIWNGDVAAAVDRSACEVEIQLRNFMDHGFSQWNTSPSRCGSPEWLLYPMGKLAEITTDKNGIALASMAEIRPGTETPTHDDYVAGLTFGQWVHLLPKPHAGERNARVVLWNEALEPNLSSYGQNSTNRRRFQGQALAVKELRNRATHRRPLVKDQNRIQNAHRDCIELLRAINPELGDWFKNQKWIPSVLATSPIPRE